ncbi:transglycosylase SLT domain-containing protein [bacterium]|nr:transglycosylase SLT domain-containing protein [bacterium]
MFSRSFFLYFVVLFSGLLVFSPSRNNAFSSTEIVQNSISISLKGIYNLPEEDIRMAELYIPYILKYTENKDISIPLVLAVIKAESNFRSQAISHKGALGLMQLMPTTALDEYRDYGMDAPLHQLEKNLIKQPELNIALGIKHIQRLQSRLEGIENPDKFRQLVIVSYNAGIHRVKRAFKCKGFECYKYKANRYSNRYFNNSIRSLPAETRMYLQNVEIYYKQYKDAFSQNQTSEFFTT